MSRLPMCVLDRGSFPVRWRLVWLHGALAALHVALIAPSLHPATWVGVGLVHASWASHLLCAYVRVRHLEAVSVAAIPIPAHGIPADATAQLIEATA